MKYKMLVNKIRKSYLQVFTVVYTTIFDKGV